MTRPLLILVILSLSFLLNACSDRVELHRQLTEQEANEVVAELADKHIRATKVPAKDGVVVVVNATDIGRAVRTLEAAGLPRVARATLGDTAASGSKCNSQLIMLSRLVASSCR